MVLEAFTAGDPVGDAAGFEADVEAQPPQAPQALSGVICRSGSRRKSASRQVPGISVKQT